MACILLWSSDVRVHVSQAYRKMDVTREHINCILELSEIHLVIFLTWPHPLWTFLKPECSCQKGRYISLVCMMAYTGVGRQLHTLLSHPTLGEPERLRWRMLTTPSSTGILDIQCQVNHEGHIKEKIKTSNPTSMSNTLFITHDNLQWKRMQRRQ